MISMVVFYRPFGFGGWLIGILVLLLLLSLVFRVFAFSSRRRYWHHGGQSRLRTPEQILARRFALGEIDETEYRGRLAALHSPTGPGA